MPQNPPGDEEILAAVRALQAGADPDAFEVVYRRFFPPLFRFFANQRSLREEAEDLAQATLLRAYQNIHLYRDGDEASFSAWLRQIGENVWKNAVRERLAAKRTPVAAGGQPAGGESREDTVSGEAAAVRDEAPNPEEAALADEKTRALQDAIAALPPGMRRCTELRLFSELKYREIAEVMGIGLNSVRSQLFEARQRLKPVLDEHFQGADF